MKLYVGVTDNERYRFLSLLPNVNEVNSGSLAEVIGFRWWKDESGKKIGMRLEATAIVRRIEVAAHLYTLYSKLLTS